MHHPWKLVNGPASAVVASMMPFGWQVLSGTEFGTHKGVLSFASVGHGELYAVLQDAYDRWTWERACHRIPALALVGGPPLTTPLAMQHLRTSARARVGLCCWAMRTQNLERLERFSLDRSCQLCQASVGSLWHRVTSAPHLESSDAAAARTSIWTNGSTANRFREFAGILWT